MATTPRTTKGITMTDMITVSRKEIEDAIDTLYIETFSGEPYIAGTRKILALLDKAEVVHGEAVAFYWVDKDGNKLYSAPYFGLPSNETVESANLRQHYHVPLYTTPQPLRIAELEAEIARLKAITLMLLKSPS